MGDQLTPAERSLRGRIGAYVLQHRRRRFGGPSHRPPAEFKAAYHQRLQASEAA